MEEKKEVLQERYQLVTDRIREIPGEAFEQKELKEYFDKMAEFLLLLDDTKRFLEEGGLQKASLEELQARNHALYEDVLPENYAVSYGNPDYAAERLGDVYGQELCWLYARLRRLICAVYEGDEEELAAGMELFAEVYAAFTYDASEKLQPDKAAIRDTIYWFASDYAPNEARRQVRDLVCTEGNRYTRIIMESDLQDVRYLYAYGKYVSENELKTARYLAGLPEETIATMADTYTEGYRIGFEVTGKDLSKKTGVEIWYRMGFERMIRRAVENFAKLNLQPALGFDGIEGGTVNRQYAYDHKDDQALYLDKNYVNRRIEGMRQAFEGYKQDAAGFGGPAVLETFGEAEFDPVNKPAAIRFTEEQNKLWVEYLMKKNNLEDEYINSEEYSYTIIAFPIPEVGPVFEELFGETIRINTLDYALYRDVQQKLIDALDTADYCEVKGSGANRTDLRVNLWKLENPEKETIFENCVADVNIPVGEVFTSPVLKGTNGLLHVTRVYLNGLEYKNLAITFEDGMITDYTCDNFEKEEENRSFIRENVLFRQETLPIGEFAIGTNTTAYVAARRLGVEAKLPILIAEKTGPHFAVGDTCYAHAEESRVYNPNGKEIVARENEKSRLRHTKPEQAYFNCHTDITIPYDELEELTAVRKDGARIAIIKKGRFVLPGTEPLNEAFENV